jgi:hypothetical protein
MVRFHKWPKWAIPNTVEFNERRAHAWFENSVQISLAGQIAEALHAGRSPVRASHKTDYDQAFNIATQVCGSDEECSAWLKLLFIRTRERLRQPWVWQAVEALAEELIKREAIPGAEAREIISQALSTPTPFTASQGSR